MAAADERDVDDAVDANADVDADADADADPDAQKSTAAFATATIATATTAITIARATIAAAAAALRTTGPLASGLWASCQSPSTPPFVAIADRCCQSTLQNFMQLPSPFAGGARAWVWAVIPAKTLGVRAVMLLV